VNKSQWITAGTALLLTLGLYAATQDAIFGANKLSHEGHDHAAEAPAAEAASKPLSTDTVLGRARRTLSPERASRIAMLEASITRGNVQEQKEHVYHQLARFWYDTGRVFEPYAFYKAEEARLVNSENSLTFAAHLFLGNLRAEEDPALKSWKALQARDLFERSLKLNPANDSSEVGLGATLLYGGIGASPMEAIGRIRKVAERNPQNLYAQLTLGHASLVSGQLDKAIERFQNVWKQDARNLEAILSLADTYERKEDKKNAIVWYKQSLPLIPAEALRGEVEQRIRDLSK
jgi:tetratricopeptide (TPR) repeat protein